MHIPVWGCLVLQVVMGDDIIGQVRKSEAHILKTLHWGVEIKILDVNCHVACILCRDGAVLVEVDSEEAQGGCSTVSRVDDVVAPHGQACSVWIVFGRLVAHDDASVCDVFPSLGGNVCFGNEEKGVSAFDSAGHAWASRPTS